MQLKLDISLTKNYKSHSQITKILTESWVSQQAFCPSCGSNIVKYPNNQPAADFYCSNPKCSEEYELKSKKNRFGAKIVNGAYSSLIERLQSNYNPNLFLLNYTFPAYEITNFFIIPRYFFIPQIIQKRNPLSSTARRAGWVGCNIILEKVPQTGKIFYIKDGVEEPQKAILQNWQKIIFLKKEKDISNRSWLLDIMLCIDEMGKKEFTLNEIYEFETELSNKHPDNHHIKDKIRQQLQILRDNSYIRFLGRGKYRLI